MESSVPKHNFNSTNEVFLITDSRPNHPQAQPEGHIEDKHAREGKISAIINRLKNRFGKKELSQEEKGPLPLFSSLGRTPDLATPETKDINSILRTFELRKLDYDAQMVELEIEEDQILRRKAELEVQIKQQEKQKPPRPKSPTKVSRRKFMKTATEAAAGILISTKKGGEQNPSQENPSAS